MNDFLKKCRDCGDWRCPEAFKRKESGRTSYRAICPKCLRLYNARAQKAYKERKRLGLKALPRVYAERDEVMFKPERTPYTPQRMDDFGSEVERGVVLVASVGLPVWAERVAVAA